MTYDDRNAAALSQLEPVARDIFTAFLYRLETEEHEDVLVTDGRRSVAEQNAIYAKGRTEPGEIVTDAKNDTSFHVWGVAIDLVPIGLFGQLQYEQFARYDRIAWIANSMGIAWLYAQIKKDRPHFEYRQGLTIADFRKGKKLKPLPKGPTKEDLDHRLKIAKAALKNPRVALLRKSALTRFVDRFEKALARMNGL